MELELTMLPDSLVALARSSTSTLKVPGCAPIPAVAARSGRPLIALFPAVTLKAAKAVVSRSVFCASRNFVASALKLVHASRRFCSNDLRLVTGSSLRCFHRGRLGEQIAH